MKSLVLYYSRTGKKLTNKILNWFKTKNAKWSIVLTHEKDKPAISYWKNLGYEDYNIKYKLRI